MTSTRRNRPRSPQIIKSFRHTPQQTMRKATLKSLLKFYTLLHGGRFLKSENAPKRRLGRTSRTPEECQDRIGCHAFAVLTMCQKAYWGTKVQRKTFFCLFLFVSSRKKTFSTLKNNFVHSLKRNWLKSLRGTSWAKDQVAEIKHKKKDLELFLSPRSQ